jgi:hypothetical protein
MPEERRGRLPVRPPGSRRAGGTSTSAPATVVEFSILWPKLRKAKQCNACDTGEGKNPHSSRIKVPVCSATYHKRTTGTLWVGATLKVRDLASVM